MEQGGRMFNKVSILDEDFVEALQYRFQQTTQPGVLTDVYDGAVYAELSVFFESKFNVSFGLNYDGAPVFKSSSMQIWPVQLFLNELPPPLRYACGSGVV